MSHLDTRVQYTKTKIKDCFIQIFNNKPIEKITVTEVCDTAKINRSTFYFYFNNCFDLFEKIKQETFDEFRSFVQEMKAGHLSDIFDEILMNIKENHFYYSAIAARDKNFMAQMIDVCFQQANNSDIHSLFKTRGIDRKEYYYFVAYGCSGILSYWICNGMQKSISDVSKLLVKLVRHNSILTK